MLTEVTFKVVPWPETAVTVVYLNLPDNLAVELLSAAMAQPVEYRARCTCRLRSRPASAIPASRPWANR